jgi:hypothetical protein
MGMEIPLTAYQRRLSKPDVDALCAAARRAWDASPMAARRVRFVWRGKTFVAHHTTFRLLVDELNGAPVVCRYD